VLRLQSPYCRAAETPFAEFLLDRQQQVICFIFFKRQVSVAGINPRDDIPEYSLGNSDSDIVIACSKVRHSTGWLSLVVDSQFLSVTKSGQYIGTNRAKEFFFGFRVLHHNCQIEAEMEVRKWMAGINR